MLTLRGPFTVFYVIFPGVLKSFTVPSGAADSSLEITDLVLTFVFIEILLLLYKYEGVLTHFLGLPLS
jgi:hypothetical protein